MSCSAAELIPVYFSPMDSLNIEGTPERPDSEDHQDLIMNESMNESMSRALV